MDASMQNARIRFQITPVLHRFFKFFAKFLMHVVRCLKILLGFVLLSSLGDLSMFSPFYDFTCYGTIAYIDRVSSFYLKSSF